MTLSIQRIALATTLALLASACGGGDSDSKDSPDAGVSGCSFYVSLSSETEVGSTVTATVVEDVSSLSGERAYSWLVQDDAGQAVGFSLGGQEQSVAFELTSPGIYTVRVSGSISGVGCSSGESTLTAVATGANVEIYQLHVQPPTGSALISTTATVAISGGGSASLGDRVLVNAAVVSGTVVDENAGPTPAYIRAIPESGSVRECFAGSDGVFSLALDDRPYRLEVYPNEPGLAPLVIESFTSSSSSALQLPTGESVAGFLRDSAGQPIAGATVSVKGVDQIASLAQTNADGSFIVRGEFINGLMLRVHPPESSNLPVLLQPDVSSSLAGLWQIEYSAFIQRDLDAAVKVSTGESVGLRQAYLRSQTIVDAGLIRIGASSYSLEGEHVLRAQTSVDGKLRATLGPSAYALLLSGSPAASVSIPAGSLAPATLTALAPATVQVSIHSKGEPVGGVEIATWSDSAAGIWIPTTAVADDNGIVDLTVTPGVDFQIRTSSTLLFAAEFEKYSALEAGAVTVLDPIEMAPAQRIRGRVVRSGGAMVPGAHVALFCQDCSATRDQPLASAVTNDAGRFELRPADPGVSE